MSQDIYIVWATSGSHMNEDRDDWAVCAYPTLELAEAHAAKARRIAARLKKAQDLWRSYRYDTWRDTTTYFSEFGDPRGDANPYDPGMRYKDDIRYYVVSLPMLSVLGKLPPANVVAECSS